MVENDSLNELNFPGLKIILSSKQSIWIRIVWALAIVFSIGLFCVQTVERIDFFINHSTGNKVVESEEIVPVLPKLSICNSPETLYNKNNYRIKSFTQNIPTWLCELKNQSIDDSFKKLRIPITDVNLMGKDNRNKWRKLQFAYQRWNSQLGSCITLSPEIETPVRNLQLTIKDSWYTPNPAKNISCFKFYIHEENTPFTPEWIIKHSTLQSTEPLTAIIDSSKFSFLNSSKKPCVSKEYYELCRRLCLERACNLTHCDLPYMTSINHDIAPKCPNRDQCINSVEQALSIYIEFTPRKCNCGKKCERFLYNVQLSRTLTNRYHGDILPTAHLELQFETFTLIKEYVTYNFVSLLSDIGGSLGLTLGLSILALVETISGLINWMRRIKIKRMESKLVANSIPKQISRLAADAENVYRESGGKHWFHFNQNFLIMSCCFKKRGKLGQESKHLAEEDELPEISIPGISVFYIERKIGRKIFWLIALTVCLVLSIMQINSHAQYLRNNSTAIRVSVEGNEAVKFPRVTLCPVTRESDLKYNRGFQRYKYFEKCAKLGYNDTSHICDFLRIPSTNIRKVWTCYRADGVYSVQHNLDYKLPRPRDFGTRHFSKVAGVCLATKLEVKFPQNHFFYDITATIPHWNWKVSGHPELFNMYLSDSIEFSDFEIFQHAQPIKINTITYVTVQITRFSYLNRSQSPCFIRGEVNHRRHQCLANTIRQHAACCTPGLGLDSIPQCKDSESCRRYHGHFISTIRKFNWDKCEKQFRTCEGTVYKFSRYSTQHSVNTTSVIKFHFQDLAVKYVEEYVTYNFISLLCDVGSIFGVMMGACLLTILQLIELTVFGIKLFFKCKISKLKVNTIFIKRR